MPTAFLCECPPDPDASELDACEQELCDAIVAVVDDADGPLPSNVFCFVCTDIEPCIQFVKSGNVITSIVVGGVTFAAT